MTLYTSLSNSYFGKPAVNVEYNKRGYLSISPDVAPDTFYTPNLLGGSVEYDLDLSKSECGCIAAFYITKMPAIAEDGTYARGPDGMFYCDSSGYGGQPCPDLDIMEANKYALLTAPNPCEAPNSKGHYYQCDNKVQCLRNTKDNLPYQAFGPGFEYVIDTDYEFHVKIDFNTDKQGRFSSYTTTLSQDGKEVHLDGDCPSYVDRLSDDLREGMAFAFSSWGSPD